MVRKIILICIVWVTLVSSSFVFSYRNTKAVERTLALQTAQSFFDQVLITRAWNALHGGIYIPVSDETQPNPYLDDPARDLVVNATLKLTMVNPAFMTRQISEIAQRTTGIQFHITSLKPIRPTNQATVLELESLKLFENGEPEVGRIITRGDQRTFFYMAPLKTEQSCLRCHAKQGYKVGQIRGGISVTLPFVPKISVMALAFGHIAIGLFGLLGIIVFGCRLGHAYESIKRQSVMDALTEIPNRRSFIERIEIECNRSQREGVALSVIMGDIDYFKQYNDTYGHKAGDECLNRVAQAIKKSLRRPGDFCARYGGEEFVVVLANTSKEGGLVVAETIRKNILDMAIAHKKSSWNIVSLSLGVAESNKDMPLTSDDIVVQADSALYTAKEKGRNRVEAFGGSGNYEC